MGLTLSTESRAALPCPGPVLGCGMSESPAAYPSAGGIKTYAGGWVCAWGRGGGGEREGEREGGGKEGETRGGGFVMLLGGGCCVKECVSCLLLLQ
jgi:hypothetical protein